MDRKIVFFDIDGTLMDSCNYIPESTKRAIAISKKRRNLHFLCTGRTCSMFPNPLLELGMDGVIGGGGTFIQVGGRILENRELSREEVEASLNLLKKGTFGFVYEGKDCVHVMPWEHYAAAEEYQEYIERIGAPCETIDVDHPDRIHTAKFSGTFGLAEWDYCEQMERALSPWFHRIVHQAPELEGSSRAATEGFAEFLPNGYDKAGGIQKVLRYLGISLDAAYAFGDSNNDLEMLRLVPHSVCMGNGTADARRAAEHVTSDIKDDGIYNAMERYGLLG